MKSLSSMLFVGLDIGGTKMEAVLAKGTGEILARHRCPTPRGASAKVNLKTALDTIAGLLATAGVKPKLLSGIGMGAPGVVDPVEGCVVYAPNLSMTDLNVVTPARKRFGCPVALGNDVNVGTLGEKWAGSARGAESAFGIMVGTGIGGGLVVDRKLVVGARYAAAEIGHIPMHRDGPKCGCGRKGCLEALASRLAIERDIRVAVKAGRKTLLTSLLDGDLASIRSKALSKALRKKDPLVTEVVRRAAEWLGYACVTVRHLVDPEVIVLGGGVMEACGDFILPIVLKIIDERSMPGARSKARVVRSELGDDAGVLGAVALVEESLGIVPFGGAYVDKARGTCGIKRGTCGIVELVGPNKVRIDGETFTRDIYIRADGTVKKRKKSVAKATLGSSHVVAAAELAKILKGDPKVLIIGVGGKPCLRLAPDARSLLKKRRIALRTLPNAGAVQICAAEKARKALLLHLGC